MSFYITHFYICIRAKSNHLSKVGFPKGFHQILFISLWTIYKAPADKNSFEVLQVWLNHHFRRPEVKTGTSGYDRLVKMSKSKFTSSIYPLQYDLGILNYYICN